MRKWGGFPPPTSSWKSILRRTIAHRIVVTILVDLSEWSFVPCLLSPIHTHPHPKNRDNPNNSLHHYLKAHQSFSPKSLSSILYHHFLLLYYYHIIALTTIKYHDGIFLFINKYSTKRDIYSSLPDKDGVYLIWDILDRDKKLSDISPWTGEKL